MLARHRDQGQEIRDIAALEPEPALDPQRGVQAFVTTTAARALTALAAEINGGPQRGAIAAVKQSQGHGRAQATLTVVSVGPAPEGTREPFVCAIYGYVSGAVPRVDILIRPAGDIDRGERVLAGPLRLPGLEDRHWSQLSDWQLQRYIAAHYQAASTASPTAARELSPTWLEPDAARRAG